VPDRNAEASWPRRCGALRPGGVPLRHIPGLTHDLPLPIGQPRSGWAQKKNPARQVAFAPVKIEARQKRFRFKLASRVPKRAIGHRKHGAAAGRDKASPS